MNAINVIFPYKFEDMWVFDDASKGLDKEPFVAGADTILDLWSEQLGAPGGELRLVFSANPFPGYAHEAEWVRTELNGNVYRIKGSGIEGWLCPALLRYFETAPASLFIEAKLKK